MPLLMVMHNCEYVATASTAFMEDYYAKVEKAIEAAKKGMAYIHVFSPCPTGWWRFPPGKLIEATRKTVETNIIPLWEYEYREGRIRFTHPADKPLPVQAYLSLIGKYKHLDEKQIVFIQEQTDRKIGVLKKFEKGEGEGSPITGNQSVAVPIRTATPVVSFAWGGWTICLFHMND